MFDSLTKHSKAEALPGRLPDRRGECDRNCRAPEGTPSREVCAEKFTSTSDSEPSLNNTSVGSNFARGRRDAAAALGDVAATGFSEENLGTGADFYRFLDFQSNRLARRTLATNRI